MLLGWVSLREPNLEHWRRTVSMVSMSRLEEVCVEQQVAADEDEPLPAAADEPSPPEQAVLDLDCPVVAPVDLEFVTVLVESPASPEGWVCSECTLHNETGAQFYDACDEPALASTQKC